MKPLPPFQVIYQTAEDGLGDTVKPRLIEAEADLDRVLVIDEAKQELTLSDERMLNELVEKIEVYNAEKINGVWEQRLRIHYNCVGEITIPKMLPLPIPDVTVNTRKGVFVNYTPAEIAG